MAVIRIYDGKSFIGEVTEEQIIVTMGGEAAMANEHMKKDFEGLMAFVRSRSSEENGVITADMRELLKGNGLDAAKTTSLFWLAAVMGQKKILNKLSPVTVMKLLPLIAAKTKAAELNKKSMGNDLERLLEFSRAYTECSRGDDCGYGGGKTAHRSPVGKACKKRSQGAPSDNRRSERGKGHRQCLCRPRNKRKNVGIFR